MIEPHVSRVVHDDNQGRRRYGIVIEHGQDGTKQMGRTRVLWLLPPNASHEARIDKKTWVKTINLWPTPYPHWSHDFVEPAIDKKTWVKPATE